MQWDGEATVSDGVRERRFIIEREGDRFPGYLWTREGAGAEPVPLVLVGHGGRTHKKDPKIVARAGELVRREGFAAAVMLPSRASAAAGEHRKQPSFTADIAQRWTRALLSPGRSATIPTN